MSGPARWKHDDELTIDEIRARRRDPSARFENPEWRDAADAVLRDAGLLEGDSETAVEDMSTDQFLKRRQRNRAAW